MRPVALEKFFLLASSAAENISIRKLSFSIDVSGNDHRVQRPAVFKLFKVCVMCTSDADVYLRCHGMNQRPQWDISVA